jgi:acyl carrier protein
MSTVKDEAWAAQLQELWMEVLGVETVHEYDDFFDLGGHSLSALRLSTLIKMELEVTVEFKEILDHPRYGELADVVAEAPHYVLPADYLVTPPAPEHAPEAGAGDRP